MAKRLDGQMYKTNFPQPFHSVVNIISLFQVHPSASRLSFWQYCSFLYWTIVSWWKFEVWSCLSCKSGFTVTVKGLLYQFIFGWESLNFILGNSKKINKYTANVNDRQSTSSRSTAGMELQLSVTGAIIPKWVKCNLCL